MSESASHDLVLGMHRNPMTELQCVAPDQYEPKSRHIILAAMTGTAR